ncbi:Phenylalanyl-tRNA synthetase alpha chain [Rubellimicrobium mesophilum DSM 19309]|uniref:Phenylalanyl-tRNA synthetase alpha chain n=1 Tax=Rubellimicrobium mesophilum DSM 19309 TaxID=442562 RepID=A0A017HJT4_9RHOB|nr:Phenylalanyl-tRNA synthetase alpha chain [Rubellimicrobium mesophilum DSM 19309]
MDDLRDKYLNAVGSAASEAQLEEVRLAALGKKGEIALRMRELGGMSPEERMTVAPTLNAIRDEVAAAVAARKAALQDAALDERLRAEWLDVTLPVARAAWARSTPSRR